MIVKSKTEILQELKKVGYRNTKHRQAIISFVAERQDHPSVRQIFSQLKSENSGISLATVYNTLNLLVEMNLLREIDFEETDNRYDTNLSPHFNLICTICGSITDFEHELPVSAELIRVQKGFIAKEYRLEYRGICHPCQGIAR
jgi:Fur family peroxide stress response transcriptional regulator